eukprot:541303-Amphidinium_carterae.1
MRNQFVHDVSKITPNTFETTQIVTYSKQRFFPLGGVQPPVPCLELRREQQYEVHASDKLGTFRIACDSSLKPTGDGQSGISHMLKPAPPHTKSSGQHVQFSQVLELPHCARGALKAFQHLGISSVAH